MTLPYPLHPLVIHFPIVLIILTPFFIFANFIFRKNLTLTWITALIAIAACATVYLAEETGEMDASKALIEDAATARILGEHGSLAETTVLLSSITAILVLGTSLFFIKNEINIVLLALALIFSVLSVYFVYRTAEHGGQLVFEHGVGIIKASPEHVETPVESEPQLPDVPLPDPSVQNEPASSIPTN
jgi:uncharacterized membrane protein